MNTNAAPDFLDHLYTALQDTTYGTTEGLRELHDLLLREGVCEQIDPSKIDVKGKMGCLMCADPERQHHMHQGAHSLFHAEARGRVAPVKVFGGPLLIVNGVKSSDVPLSPDASTDVLGQILIGQIIGKLDSIALTLHFPCGFAARAKKNAQGCACSISRSEEDHSADLESKRLSGTEKCCRTAAFRLRQWGNGHYPRPQEQVKRVAL